MAGTLDARNGAAAPFVIPAVYARSLCPLVRFVLGPREDALRHRGRFFLGARAEDLRPHRVRALVGGCGLGREFREVAGEAEITRGRELARPVGETGGAAREIG